MSTVVIKPEALESTLLKLLEKYGDEAYDITEQTAKSVARQATSELKSAEPGGKYSRGWSHKKQSSGRTTYTDTVYNRTDYQLTHLLEKPHETGGGGHYPKNVDYTGTIAKVEDKYADMFMEEVLRKL